MKGYLNIALLMLFLITGLCSNLKAQCSTPFATITTSKNKVCNGESITLTATYQADYSYTWMIQDLQPLPTGNQNAISTSWSTSGQKHIMVRVTNGCGSTNHIFESLIYINVIDNTDFNLTPVIGVSSVCSGTYTYALSQTSGLTDFDKITSIVWSVNGGGSVNPIVDPLNKLATYASVTWGTIPGNYTLTATATNSCNNIVKIQSLPVTINLGSKPNNQATINNLPLSGFYGIMNSVDVLCLQAGGTNRTYSVPSEPGITYQWGIDNLSDGSNGTIISTNHNSITINWHTLGQDKVWVQRFEGICRSEINSAIVYVYPKPTIGVLSSDKTSACENESVLLSVNNFSGFVTIQVRKYKEGFPSPAWEPWFDIPGLGTGSVSYTLPSISSEPLISKYEFRARSQTNLSEDCTIYSNSVEVTRKLNQSLTSINLSAIVYGSAPVNLSVSSTSGLPITYSSSNPSIASISGNTLTVNAVGNTLISASQSGNTIYCASSIVTQTLTVSKAQVTATSNASKVYGDTNPPFSITYTGFVNGDNSSVIDLPPTATTTASQGSNVGTYPITLSGGSDNNYIITRVNGILTISKASLTVTAANTSRLYGSANPVFTLSYSGFKFGQIASVIDAPPSITTAAVSTSNAGNYPITPSGGLDNNYTFNYVNGTLAVNKATLNATTTNASRTYGAANPTFAINYTGFVNGDNPSVIDNPPIGTSTATGASNSGSSHPITVSGGTDNNYSFTYGTAATLTITKAALTATSTATKVYGSANPAFPITYTGLMNGETATVIDTPPTTSSTATTTSNVGSYPITLSGGSDNNYTITNQTGSLSVTKKNLTATAVSTSKYVGQPNPPFSISYSGFVNGENSSVLDVQPVTSTTATTGSPIGSYPINISGGSDNNYAYTYVNGALSVLAVPTCSFYISQSGDLCTEGRIQLRANATSGTPATYLWSNGLTTNRISIHWGGTYSVTVTFSNGCTQTQSIYVEDPVGPGCIYYLKAEPLQFLQTSEFPNPVNTELTVEIANDLLETNSHDIPVILLDPSGKTTFASSFKKDNNQIKIDTQNMPAGLYLLQIGSGKTGVVRKKVMVVH